MSKSLRLIAGLLIGAALPASVYAQTAAPSNTTSSAQTRVAQVAPAAPAQQTAQLQQSMSYVPPMRGAPDARVGGGTRGLSDGRIDVLAPNHVGLTLQEQPTLYWYNSKPISGDVEITIIADETNKTVLDATVRGPIPAGIHGFRLAGTAAKLSPNVTYQWAVTKTVSASSPSGNTVASGMVERVSASRLKRPAPAGGGVSAAAAYGESGIWYDAIDALSLSIQQSPGDISLHRYRAELLAQVGLQEAADFDWKK